LVSLRPADGTTTGAAPPKSAALVAHAWVGLHQQPGGRDPPVPSRGRQNRALAPIAQPGADLDAAQAVIDWATAHPHIWIVGGAGLSYPSVTMSADSGRSRSRFRGVLSLYGSSGRERPFLEIRVKQRCRTPPYNRADAPRAG
jgi:hypothetical protein